MRLGGYRGLPFCSYGQRAYDHACSLGKLLEVLEYLRTN